MDKIKGFTAPCARVLIVDDMLVNHRVTAAVLKPLLLKVDEALNGKEALEKIYENDYDLVLMDHMMPIMDGGTATKMLRERPEEKYQKLPVIAVTANISEGEKSSFLDAGFSDFLSKPINVDEVLSCFYKWLPDEKIVEEKDSPAVVSEDDAADIAISVDIPGIEPNMGIRYSGSSAVFLELLGDVHELIDDKCALIERYLDEGDIKDFTIQVHALKTTCRMIGAMQLSERFFELEKIGSKGEIEKAGELTPAVLAEFRALKPHLASYVKEKDDPHKDFDKGSILILLNSLRDAVSDFELNKADETMKALLSYRYDNELSDKMNALSGLVSELDYTEADELISDIIKTIS